MTDVAPAPRETVSATATGGVAVHAARIAGVSLLAMGVLAIFSFLLGIDSLVTDGDGARTAADLAESETAFRWSILGLAAVATLDLVVAWALWIVFRPVDIELSRLAGWTRAGYGVAFLVAIAHLRLAIGADAATVLEPIETFQAIWELGLGVFGLHLILIGWLAWRSAGVPRLIAALVALAGAGYLWDAVAVVGFGDDALLVGAATSVGEIILALWLTVKGARLDAGPR